MKENKPSGTEKKPVARIPKKEKPKPVKSSQPKPSLKAGKPSPPSVPERGKPQGSPQPAPQVEKKQESRSRDPYRVTMMVFNRWDTSQVSVNDPGLRAYINLDSMTVPRTGGRYGTGVFQKNRMPLVERFMNRLMVSGHRGKKHKLTSGRHAGKVPKLYNTMKQAFLEIEKKTNQNPFQVLVGAIENAALLEEVASYRLGGIIARNAVITSPQRRLDLALRHLTQGIYRSSFRNRQPLSSIIATELIAAYNNDSKSFAVSERNRMEKEAEGAR